MTAFVALLLMMGAISAARAQDAWLYTSEVPCASAPVYGIPFNSCAISNKRTFRIGTVQSWRLGFADEKSEFAIGLYNLIEPAAGSGMSPIAPSGMVAWIQAAEALKPVTSGGTGWALSGNRYVTFQKVRRQCVAFVRNAPVVNGQQRWILGAAFCREATAPIPTTEADFIADSIKVRL